MSLGKRTLRRNHNCICRKNGQTAVPGPRIEKTGKVSSRNDLYSSDFVVVLLPSTLGTRSETFKPFKHTGLPPTSMYGIILKGNGNCVTENKYHSSTSLETVDRTSQIRSQYLRHCKFSTCLERIRLLLPPTVSLFTYCLVFPRHVPCLMSPIRVPCLLLRLPCFPGTVRVFLSTYR